MEYSFNNINWDFMRQLNVFKQGRIKAEPIPKDTYKSKNTLRPE